MNIEIHLTNAEAYLKMASEKVKAQDYDSALASLVKTYENTRMLIEKVYKLSIESSQSALPAGEDTQMELSELILLVLKFSNSACQDYTRGAIRIAAEDLAYISNKINTELPNIELPPLESPESPVPAGEDSG